MMTPNRRRLHWSIPLLLALLAGYALGSSQHALKPGVVSAQAVPDETLFDAFWQVWEHVRNDFVDPAGVDLDPATLVEGAMRGLVASLQDEHSGYLGASEYQMMKDDWSGTIEGIGAVVETDDSSGHLKIAWVLPGSPAEAAGLQSGDVFSAVNGEDVLAASQLELAAIVRGPVGSTVELTMLRGEETHHFTITRARIEVPNVEWQLVGEPGFGYIELQHFNENARAQLDEALGSMNAASLPGLVLDLRNNPGGLLDSAIAVASAFIEDGPLLLQDDGERRQELVADGSHVMPDIPLVVLVNERSASASELVAGALQDRDRATIVGAATYGKGTMQNLFPLNNGGGLQLTIARWLTPAGRWIHESGVTPDLTVEQSGDVPAFSEDLQLQAAIGQLQSMIADAAA